MLKGFRGAEKVTAIADFTEEKPPPSVGTAALS
jgi:hypothetical protein